MNFNDKDSIPLLFRYCYEGSDTLEKELFIKVNAPILKNCRLKYYGCIRYPGDDFYIQYALKNYGTGIALNPLISNINCTHSMASYTTLDTTFNTLAFNQIDTTDSVIYFKVSIEPESFWVMYDSLYIINYIEYTTSDNYTCYDTISIQIRDPVKLYDNFEEGDFWTHTGLSWCIVDFLSYLGSKSMHNSHDEYYYNNMQNNRIISPQFIPVSSGEYYLLTFWHKYKLEEGNDGVQLQFTNRFPYNWSTVSTLEGYTGVSTDSVNGFSLGDSIFTGNHFDVWQKQNVIFEHSEEESLRQLHVCWNFGSNNTIVDSGYYFDEVLVFRYSDTTGENENMISLSIIPEKYDFRLYPLYPSIIRSRGIITYSIGESCNIELTIYDISGREVVNLVNAYQSPGLYRVEWDGRDNGGRLVASGIYFYRLETDIFKQSNKFTLVR